MCSQLGAEMEVGEALKAWGSNKLSRARIFQSVRFSRSQSVAINERNSSVGDRKLFLNWPP